LEVKVDYIDVPSEYIYLVVTKVRVKVGQRRREGYKFKRESERGYRRGGGEVI